MHVNPHTFSTRIEPDWVDLLTQVRDELSTLAFLASYMVFYPRKWGKAHNSVDYSSTVVASVRNHYGERHGYKAGESTDLDLVAYLKCVYNGLAKLAPTQKSHHLPILQKHLRKVRETIDLEDATYRAFWAPCLTQWQGVCRRSDLLFSAAEKSRAWQAETDGHCGMVYIESLSAEKSFWFIQRRTRCVRLWMKPSKMNTAGEKAHVKTFLVAYTPDALSARRALV